MALTRLSVNVNKVALVRNSRQGTRPDPVVSARLALQAGAGGVTVHPRPDARHIRPSDVTALAAMLADEGWRPGPAEFNIEGNPFEGRFLSLVEATRPDQATLVPDTTDQATSDHGWRFPEDGDRLTAMVKRLHGWGCRVSLFMDADARAMAAAAATGARRVEIYTEPFASAWLSGEADAMQRELDRVVAAADAAREAGLTVNAGHDLNLDNLGPLLDRVPDIAEVSIGHALIADAIELGVSEAVGRYLAVIERSASAR